MCRSTPGKQRKSKPKLKLVSYRAEGICNHGPTHVTEGAQQFMREFLSQLTQLRDDHSDCCGQMAVESCIEMYPDTLSDKSNKDDITKLMTAPAIDQILGWGDSGLFVAQEIATAICILEEAPVRKIRDLRQDGKPTLLVFFGKRAQCNCLKEKYEEARKMPKQGKCDGCGNDMERRMLKLCACQVHQYCSATCQRESWAGHKLYCQTLRSGNGKKSFTHRD